MLEFSKPSMRWRTCGILVGWLRLFSKPSMRWRTCYQIRNVGLYVSKPSMRWRTQVTALAVLVTRLRPALTPPRLPQMWLWALNNVYPTRYALTYNAQEVNSPSWRNGTHGKPCCNWSLIRLPALSNTPESPAC